eukprot:Phypoly_transcript_01415.p1 GENE.Phypoly_transcript_01415~~Phypoly_transcript_01415.p1  ORF type:complete len:862 (+),score=91.08 Phypoly_transcript_01415:620-3205(+)
MANISLGFFLFIGAKIEAGKLFELLDDYTLEQDIHTEGGEGSELRDYHNFIRKEAHLLAKDPNALLQLGLNCPDNSVIFAEAEETIANYKPNRFFVKWHNKSQHPDPCLITIIPDAPVIIKMVLSADQTKLAAVGHIKEHGLLQVWDLQTGAQMMQCNLPISDSHNIRFSSNGLLLYYQSDWSKIEIFEIATGNVQFIHATAQLPKDYMCRDLETSPHGKIILLLSYCDWEYVLYSMENGVQEDRKYKAKNNAQSFGFISELLVGLAFLDCFLIWNLETDAITKLQPKIRQQDAYKWASCSDYIAIISPNRLELWTTTGTELWFFDNDRSYFVHGVFSKDNQNLLVWDNFTLKSTSVAGQERNFDTIVDSMPAITQLFWGPDEKLVIFNICDSPHYSQLFLSYCKVWDLKVPPLQRLGVRTKFLSDGTIMTVDVVKSSLNVINTGDMSIKRSHKVNLECEDICYSPDGSLIALVIRDSFKVQRVSTNELVCQYTDGKFLCFSPDAKKICFSPTNQKRIVVLELAEKSGLSIMLPRGLFASGYPTTALFSNNQEYLLHACSDKAQLYEFKTNVSHSILDQSCINYHSAKVVQFSFSVDDLELAIATTHEIIVYNIQKKEIDTVLNVKANWVIFDPNNSNILILGNSQGLDVMWMTKMGQLLHRFYLIDIPQSVSMHILKHSYQMVVNDRVSYSYLLSPVTEHVQQTPTISAAYPNMVTSFKEKQAKRHIPLSFKEVKKWTHDEAYENPICRTTKNPLTGKINLTRRWAVQYALPQLGSAEMVLSFSKDMQINLDPMPRLDHAKKQKKELERFIFEFTDALILCYNKFKEDKTMLDNKLVDLQNEYFAKIEAQNHFGFKKWQC